MLLLPLLLTLLASDGEKVRFGIRMCVWWREYVFGRREAGGEGRGGRAMRLWCGFCAHSVIHTPMHLKARMCHSHTHEFESESVIGGTQIPPNFLFLNSLVLDPSRIQELKNSTMSC